MKALKIALFTVLAVAGLSACSSVDTDTVISRSDELSSRPDWLTESDSFKVEDGMVYSLGSATIPADGSVEMGYRIAENNAKGSIAGAIEQRLNFVFQNAEEGVDIDSRQSRFIGAEVAKLTTSSIRPAHRYWEKSVNLGNNGQQMVQYRVFAQVAMPEQDFKKAIFDAIRRAQGKVGLSKDFAQKVEKNWNEFIEGGE